VKELRILHLQSPTDSPTIQSPRFNCKQPFRLRSNVFTYPKFGRYSKTPNSAKTAAIDKKSSHINELITDTNRKTLPYISSHWLLPDRERDLESFLETDLERLLFAGLGDLDTLLRFLLLLRDRGVRLRLRLLLLPLLPPE